MPSYSSCIACIIEACAVAGINISNTSRNAYINNTIDTCVDGIVATNAHSNLFVNNILSNHSSEGAVWTSEMLTNWWDYNDFFNCGTDRTNVTAGPNDNDVDPGYTGADDFSTGANVADTGLGIRLGVG